MRICKLKVHNNINWYGLLLGSLSKDFTEDEQSDISLNGTEYDLSVDHSLIQKEDKLITHQYLMVGKDIK